MWTLRDLGLASIPLYLWAVWLTREEILAAGQSQAAGRVRVLSGSWEARRTSSTTCGEQKVGSDAGLVPSQRLGGTSSHGPQGCALWAGGAGRLPALCQGAVQGAVSGQGHVGAEFLRVLRVLWRRTAVWTVRKQRIWYRRV